MAVRIGELLLKEQRITPAQLEEALELQKSNGGKLGYNFVKLGFVQDGEIASLLSKQYGVPSIDLSQFDIDAGVIKLVPAATAQKYEIVPVSRAGATLTIAMSDPTNVFAVDDITFMTGYRVEPVVASQTAIVAALDRYYPSAAGAEGQDTSESQLELANKALEEMPQLGDDDVEVLDEMEDVDVLTLEQQGGEAPVVRLVNVVLASAIQKGASDIHIEPYEKEYRIRYRIDGTLYNVMVPPLKFRDAITSRLKIMAKLDIAEKRLPQDGRIKLRLSSDGGTQEIDFRVSCLPTLFGEKIVMRLLDQSKLMLDMTKLGFEPDSLSKLKAAIDRPWGLVLVTGPTGSGKTNTLYSAIAQINTPATNIMTAEDPVEFNITGVNQVQMRENIGLNFAAALRSFLRQDPNVILVGEIRDFETAEIAVKAALTGHLVLSTLHTNDAPSTVNRLMNMGIEPFLVASAVNLICAQRLVRRVCTNCSEEQPTPPPALEEIGFSPAEADTVVPCKGVGCDQCNDTGYKGRIGLYEVMEINDEINEMVLLGASTLELRRKAIDLGMLTLRASGLRKVAAGHTSIEEVLKETVK
ncbi:MAG: type IV-A pilus assembly ATPase PilB [Acidobacteria bacterium]|jgi:type IV pilus assembly protein PilB|nr:type IV-A pilus assembly ATPase PilB [Acidobacteriota bacterium]HJN43108.1 type IV-A pilus assembly ATPase PilB [Vicinamibacterales bacterium]|tara:strand:+ start:644 stop:2392 length:1749 start_codon:yes stop_codon:yes gene_type:complete